MSYYYNHHDMFFILLIFRVHFSLQHFRTPTHLHIIPYTVHNTDRSVDTTIPEFQQNIKKLYPPTPMHFAATKNQIRIL